MKVLFFASDYQIGLSSLLTDQLIALNRSNIDVYPIAGEKSQEDELNRKIEYHGITLHRIDGLDTHKHFFKLCYLLKEIIKSHDIQLIHVQNNWQLAISSYIKTFLLPHKKIKIAYTLHGFRNNKPFKSILAQLIIGTALLLFADKIICMCSFLKRKFNLLSYKITVIPLGISDSFFEDHFPPMPMEGLQMVFPAQFRKGKNQQVIIRAFAQHLQNTEDKNSRLILPGSGSLLNSMVELSKSLGIEKRVIFPGRCTKEEIKQYYLMSNIGIIASNSETFGQSIVEPFVLGRCVITTPVGIAKDIISNGKNGFFFKDEKELTSLFTAIYKNQRIIQRIGASNFSARDKFNWKIISQLYKENIIEYT